MTVKESSFIKVYQYLAFNSLKMDLLINFHLSHKDNFSQLSTYLKRYHFITIFSEKMYIYFLYFTKVILIACLNLFVQTELFHRYIFMLLWNSIICCFIVIEDSEQLLRVYYLSFIELLLQLSHVFLPRLHDLALPLQHKTYI